MAVLIVTHDHDLHASALRWGLKQDGVDTDLFMTRMLPENHRLTLSISPHSNPNLSGMGLRPLTDYSSIWIRHIEAAASVSEALDEQDHPLVIDQTKIFANNILQHLDTASNVVNPLHSRLSAKSKFRQLSVAKAQGLEIPDTLVSNEPERIRAFARKYGGAVIYKPFEPPTLIVLGTAEIRVERTYTSLMTEESLASSDVAFTSAPGIYQNLIPKISELRVTFFGDTFFAVRLFSQREPSSLVDSRVAANPQMEIAELGAEDVGRCKAVVRALGLLSGTIDLIEATNGSLVFLEVNERAQFLFIEEQVPSLRLLGAAAAFAKCPSASFRAGEEHLNPAVTYAGFCRSQDYSECLLAWERVRRTEDIPYTYFFREP